VHKTLTWRIQQWEKAKTQQTMTIINQTKVASQGTVMAAQETAVIVITTHPRRQIVKPTGKIQTDIIIMQTTIAILLHPLLVMSPQ
jgi:hypothetical protein